MSVKAVHYGVFNETLTLAESLATRVIRAGGGGVSAGDTWDGEAYVNIAAGQPVAILSGLIHLASAVDNTKPVSALALHSVSATFSGDYRSAGIIDLADWSTVAGTTNLTPGATYYLSDTAGMIQTSPPVGALRSLQVVGRAVTATRLLIAIHNYGRR